MIYYWDQGMGDVQNDFSDARSDITCDSNSDFKNEDVVDDLPVVVVSTFKKTHKRDESRISKISRLSIKSLKGCDGVDGSSEFGGDGEKIKSPILKFLLTNCVPIWCRHVSFKKLLPPLWGFNSEFEWRSTASYETRLFVIGNKFTEHLFERLEINLTNKQTYFGNRNRRVKSNCYKTAKYSVWSFIPLNIFEQFRRVANIYFLLTLVMTYVVPDSPVDGTSWLLSLLFVLIVTMIKQAYEDYLRHQNDKEVNKRTVRVIHNGETEQVSAESIRVGDIIYLTEDETVPCDAVVLASSNQGQCYVMTANLDGETSLKTKEAPPMTKDCTDHNRIDKIVSCLECENPNPKLDNFLGRMFWFNSDNQVDTHSLGISNLLLAGSEVKNTKEVWAVSVYTGSETKMTLNTKITHNKFSSIEKSLNRLLIFLCGLLILEVLTSTLVSLFYGIEYIGSKPEAPFWMPIRSVNRIRITLSGPKDGEDDSSESSVEDPFHWYLGTSVRAGAEQGVLMALTFFLLYNYIIPISLYVSLEVQKFISNKLFGWDLKLYDAERNIPATSNTSDVNEELGLITHLFSDKTGTLTQNIMTFKKYCGPDGILKTVDSLASEEWSPLIACLTLCHSVVVTSDGKFAASSPDESALLEKCRDAGFEFLGEDNSGIVKVKTPQSGVISYKKLTELPFDSHRKCMSVVIKEISDAGTIHVLTKGAETAIFPVSIVGPREETRLAVDKFGNEGLRTLVFAYKVITKDEFDEFAASLAIAKLSIVNRFRFVREAYKSLESDLTLLGATGIEDKLQDDVDKTIAKLQTAGIIVWMLTGDKKETAVSLAHASGLLSSTSRVYDLCQVVDTESLVQLLDQMYNECNADVDGRWSKSSSLVVDNKAVVVILKSRRLKEKFCHVCSRCKTVIACRLAPVQKSQLVRMIKGASKNNVTAAIGDGGNDISMIQEAHVGLGIYGREGHAAAQAADFSVSQFKHLQRVFLVHGHWYYNRLAFLVQYSFYKQIACFTCQLMFATFSSFSGTSLFESMFLFLFNTIYTSVPIVIFGLSEQTFPEDTLVDKPELYRLNRGNHEMRWYRMAILFLSGLWHAGCVFFIWLFAWPTVELFGGDINTLGAVVAGSAVVVTNLKICLEARFWSWPLIFTIFWSIVSYVIGTIIYDHWLIDNVIADNSDQFRTYTIMFNSQSILYNVVVNLLIVVMALTPDLIITVFRNHNRIMYLKSNEPINES